VKFSLEQARVVYVIGIIIVENAAVN